MRVKKLEKEVSSQRLVFKENFRKDMETISKKLQKKKDQLKDVEKKSSERRMRVKKLEKEVSRQRLVFKEVLDRKRQKQYNKLTAKSLQVLMDGYNGLSEKFTQKSISREEVGKASNKEESAKAKQIEEVCLDDDEPMSTNKEKITTTDRKDGDLVEQIEEILLGISTDVKLDEKETGCVVSEVLCDVLDQVIDTCVG